MTEANPLISDDEIIALTRRKFRQRKIAILLGAVPVGAMGGFAGIQFARWHFGHRPISLFEILAFGVAILILLAGIPIMIHFTRPPQGAYSDRILVKRSDELQWQVRRFLLTLALFSLPLLAAFLEFKTIRSANHAFEIPDYFLFSIFFFLGLCTLMMLTPYGIRRAMRPVLDDELSRTMRLRALSLGFWAVTPGIAALFALSLYDRNLAVEMMIPLLYLAIAVPALRYCYLDWRAAREGK